MGFERHPTSSKQQAAQQTFHWPWQADPFNVEFEARKKGDDKVQVPVTETLQEEEQQQQHKQHKQKKKTVSRKQATPEELDAVDVTAPQYYLYR